MINKYSSIYEELFGPILNNQESLGPWFQYFPLEEKYFQDIIFLF